MPYDDLSIALAHCWAKTSPLTQLPALTVQDHCVIVGSVADQAVRLLPQACRAILGPHNPISLIAAHDIGKITPGFLAKAGTPEYSFHLAHLAESRHTTVGQVYLASIPQMQAANGRPFNWPLATDGHHGRYSINKANNRLKCYELNLTWPRRLRDQLLGVLIKYFGPLPTGEVTSDVALHWLTGFTIFCDWIGSNTDWFPLIPNGPLRNIYPLQKAREHAQSALDKINWHQRTIRQGLSFSDLFSTDPSRVMEPRPLQEKLPSLCAPNSLYIVEAPMGMGKTEAALATAYQHWTDGDERGLYFALPTQLTSNRIHERVYKFLHRTVSDANVTHALIHGNAWLQDDSLQTINPSPPGSNGNGAAEIEQATEPMRWYASNRKALLAPFGVGTIDQALMCVTNAKYSALRLFALSGKIVVIDEVHSYDPYTSSLIDRLISWLLQARCSVIVLSATLSTKRRNEMITAASAALASPGASVTPEAGTAVNAYPLITRVTAQDCTYHTPDNADTTQRSNASHTDTTSIIIEHSDAPSPSWLVQAITAATEGACVLVIRNTVALAQQTYLEAKAAMREGSFQIGLLHSRFPQFQRAINEEQWMQALGADGSTRPSGCLLIATQVVEQSVD